MNRFFLLFLLPMSLLAQTPSSLKIMSFNIRYNNPNDGDNAWPNRTHLVESIIRFHQPDLIGIQEAVKGQMDDLQKMLPDYAFHGIPRDDSKGSEYSAIWYRRSRFVLLEGSTFWLSDHPGIMSKGWDAALNRIVTWARFRDVWTGKEFFHFNTHFDHRGKTARMESAKLILQQIQELNHQRIPVLLTGDFNATPESEPYTILTQSKSMPPVKDCWTHGISPPHGPPTTWSGFKEAGVPGRRIDYIFFQQQVTVLQCGTLTDSWSGRFPSDHLPVLAEVLLDPVPVLPNAHAHNDYEHERPLFDALAHGFSSVEADVWLMEGELYVSHSKPNSLDPDKTLRKLYIDPLTKRISQHSGSVYPGSASPFFFMIDLKNEGEASYELLKDQLAPHRWMLDSQNPPVRIFLSGARPVNLMNKDSTTILGIDGRPDHLGKGFSAQKMPVISQRYSKIIKWRGNGMIPKEEREILQSLANQAHAEGKLVRLWASPEKESVWTILQETGIDFINTDELAQLQSFLIRNGGKRTE